MTDVQKMQSQLKRWKTRLRRAFNAVEDLERSIARAEKRQQERIAADKLARKAARELRIS